MKNAASDTHIQHTHTHGWQPYTRIYFNRIPREPSLSLARPCLIAAIRVFSRQYARGRQLRKLQCFRRRLYKEYNTHTHKPEAAASLYYITCAVCVCVYATENIRETRGIRLIT